MLSGLWSWGKSCGGPDPALPCHFRTITSSWVQLLHPKEFLRNALMQPSVYDAKGFYMTCEAPYLLEPVLVCNPQCQITPEAFLSTSSCPLPHRALIPVQVDAVTARHRGRPPCMRTCNRTLGVNAYLLFAGWIRQRRVARSSWTKRREGVPTVNRDERRNS